MSGLGTGSKPEELAKLQMLIAAQTQADPGRDGEPVEPLQLGQGTGALDRSQGLRELFR